MTCRICGSEQGTSWRAGRRGYLCDSCALDTPAKVSRAEFDAAYWEAGDDPGERTKAEFYDDYRNSTKTLADYIKATVSAAM